MAELATSGNLFSRRTPTQPDPVLVTLCLVLLAVGLVMVASATVTTTSGGLDVWRPFLRQSIFALLGIACATVLYAIPLEVVIRFRYLALGTGLLLLLSVLVPGLGHSANGSARWLQFGPLSLQPSEPARLLLLMYVASYAVTHRKELGNSFWGLMRPIGVLLVAGLLLLLEPDFGGTIVLFVTAIGVLFFAGARKRDTIILGVVFGGLALLLALSSPYRLERLTTFLNPWAVQQTSGFQLTQALIAVGHGGIFGVGLGQSVEKLAYLPEAQSDFLFSVLAEELGLAGVAVVVALYLAFCLRAFVIARRASRQQNFIAANVAFTLGLLVGIQGFINIGVNLGALPTKGLTLPFMSLGGSSLVVDLSATGLILRAAREVQERARRGVRR